jgi:hypothetical protein
LKKKAGKCHGYKSHNQYAKGYKISFQCNWRHYDYRDYRGTYCCCRRPAWVWPVYDRKWCTQ